MRTLFLTSIAASVLLAGCADNPPLSRDPTIGEVSGTAAVGIAAAAVISGPLAVGALAGAASTIVDPDTRLSEIFTGGYYRHRPRVCRTLNDCVFSGAH